MVNGAFGRRSPVRVRKTTEQVTSAERLGGPSLISTDGLRSRLLTVAACLALLSGCSGDERTAAGGVEVPQKNRRLWVLPLDEYFGLSFAISDYAESLLVQECMAKKGFDYPTGEPKRIDSAPLPTQSRAYRSLFTPAIAAQFGYGGPRTDPPQASLTAEERAAIASDEGQAALGRCFDRARQTLPQPPDRGLVESLSVAAFNSAVETREVREAAERWKECMAPEGISDLPDDPMEMPTDSMRATWGTGMTGEDTAYRPPSAGEIRVAVRDAECRESSGFAETLYEVEWRVQMELLRDNEDALARLKAANDKHAALVETVLTSRG